MTASQNRRETFLFVNKDLQSSSLSNNKRDGSLTFSEINSHAQQLRLSESRRRKSISSSTSRLVGWRTKPKDVPSPNDQSSNTVGQRWATGVIPYSARPPTPPDTPEELKEDENILLEHLENPVKKNEADAPLSPATGAIIAYGQSEAIIPSDYRCFRGMRTDPFNCIPARGSDCAAAVIDYHGQIMAPNHAPIYAIFDVTNVYTSYYFELLSNEDFLYTGVASVQAVIDQLRSPGQKPSANVLRHIGTAMKNLRKRLERPGATADDLTIITVLFLAVIARAIGDMSSHEVHKQSIARLVTSRGGLDALGHDGLAKCTLMQWESFWALNTGSTIFAEARPTYSPIYPEYPFEADLLRVIGRLPIGFQTLAKQRKLAIDVLEVLVRASDAQRVQDHKGKVVTPEDVFRSRPRRYHDFWEACTCLSAPDVDGPNLEKLIVLALLLYCLNTFSPMRAVTAVYNGSRMKLTNDVAKRKRGNVAEEEVLVWIWTVLVDSWRAANDSLLPKGIELLEQLKERRRDLTDWTAGDRILRKFFWNKAFAKRCMVCWDAG